MSQPTADDCLKMMREACAQVDAANLAKKAAVTPHEMAVAALASHEAWLVVARANLAYHEVTGRGRLDALVKSAEDAARAVDLFKVQHAAFLEPPHPIAQASIALLGDKIACTLHHPVERTLTMSLDTQASLAYGRELLERDREVVGGWRLVPKTFTHA